MKFERLSPNYQLSITKIDDKSRKSKMCSFYAEVPATSILTSLNRKLCATYDSKIKLSLVLTNMKTNKKYKKTFLYHDFSVEQIQTKFVKVLCLEKKIIDVKQTRYKVVIQNKSSSQLDVKVFTFNSNMSFQELYLFLKKYMIQKTKKIIANDVVFTDQKKVATTHYITVSFAGTIERRKSSSKTFSLYIPNYSSGELIEMLRGNKNE